MKHNHKHIYDLCKDHMHSYVLVETIDGAKIDGIVTGLDGEYVYMAVPLDAHEQGASDYQYPQHDRQLGYGYPGYGYGYSGYGYPGYGYAPRRFRRLVLPLAGLAALAALPWY